MKKLSLLTALLLGTTSSFAVTAQSGIYIGGFGGWSFITSPSTSSLQGKTGVATSKENRNFTLGASVGYNYALTQNFLTGAEIGYLSFGQNYYDFANGQSLYLGSQGLEGLLSGTFLANNGFNTFVKAGAIRDKQSGTLNNVAAYNTTKWLPTAVIGVGYMPMQNFNIALQYQKVFGNNNTNAVTNTSNKPQTQNAVTLGLSYTFPL
jgi:opacity protein-like surface antigen